MSESKITPPQRHAIRRARNRVAASCGDAGSLQREIGNELLERLAAVRVRPSRIVDLGCGTGAVTHELRRRYRRAEVIGIDIAEGMLARMRGRRRFGRSPLAVCADIARLPLPDASVDMLLSNLAFQWVDDLPALFGELRRVLRPDGVLLFSTLGPDTLCELRAARAVIDGGTQVDGFPDMHDLGDVMLAAGLRDPVMDVDRLSRSYADLPEMMRRIRVIGVGAAAARRSRGLAGRERLAALRRAYGRIDENGAPVASWEIVYGHAWGAATARAGKGDAREYAIPVDAIGRRT